MRSGVPGGVFAGIAENYTKPAGLTLGWRAPFTARHGMTSAARSVYVFGIYLIVLGAILMGSPNTLLSVFGFASTTEPWIRVLGVVVMAIGMLDVACARAEQTGFFRATVGTRLFALVAFAVFAAFGIAPAMLVLFGLIDAAGAAWTFVALRSMRPAVG